MLATENFPSSFNLTVKGRAGTPQAMAEVHEYRWLEPQHQTYRDDSHCIDMVLSHRPPAARGRFAEEGACPPHRIGQVIFLPCGHTLESEWSAGEQQSVCCTIEAAFCDDEVAPEPAALAGALDIRNDFVRAALARLAREALSPGFASGLVVESLCQAVLVDLKRVWLDGVPHEIKLSRINLARINEMLDVSGPAPGTSELARAFDLSGRHFARLFRATVGQSVSNYVADFRVARAKALLAEPGLLIKEIAWRTGFSNAAAFSAAFRRATSSTPQQFRAARLQ